MTRLSIDPQIKITHSSVNIELKQPEAKFKQFEQRLQFKSRHKYGWFHLESYSMFQEDLSRRSIETGFWWIGDAAQIS